MVCGVPSVVEVARHPAESVIVMDDNDMSFHCDAYDVEDTDFECCRSGFDLLCMAASVEQWPRMCG